ERTLSVQDLDRFAEAQQAALAEVPEPTPRLRHWLELTQLLRRAPTADLREGRWWFPGVDADWATAVQRHGRDLFGQSFRFLGFALHGFARSDRASRERLPDGAIRHAVLPYLGKDFIIFSGSIARALARYRLDPDHARPTLVSPFENHRFEHPRTPWY